MEASSARAKGGIIVSKIGFGGGCHWCTEAVFQALRGVTKTKQGFIRSAPPDDSFSEAVIVHFDPCVIDLNALTEIHLRTHSSQSDHSMREKYRSAVYVWDAKQRDEAELALRNLQIDFEDHLVTRVLDFLDFKPSDERFQNYYKSDSERPFCKTYIDPKLSLLRAEYSKHI